MITGCELNVLSDGSFKQSGPHNFSAVTAHSAFCTYCGKTIELKIEGE